MNEILFVITFNIICTSNFDTKCVHYTMEKQNMFVEVLNFHKPYFTFHKTINVVTLALGLQSKQMLAKVWGEKEAQESHFMLTGVQENVRE